MLDTRPRPQSNQPPQPNLSEPQVSAGGQLPAPSVRTLAADELLGGERMVLIRHGAELYRLRQTRNGKLILYK